jgi:hypothetical protein
MSRELSKIELEEICKLQHEAFSYLDDKQYKKGIEVLSKAVK